MCVFKWSKIILKHILFRLITSSKIIKHAYIERQFKFMYACMRRTYWLPTLVAVAMELSKPHFRDKESM